jgi:hypothetical protein
MTSARSPQVCAHSRARTAIPSREIKARPWVRHPAHTLPDAYGPSHASRATLSPMLIDTTAAMRRTLRAAAERSKHHLLALAYSAAACLRADSPHGRVASISRATAWAL